MVWNCLSMVAFRPSDIRAEEQGKQLFFFAGAISLSSDVRKKRLAWLSRT